MKARVVLTLAIVIAAVVPGCGDDESGGEVSGDIPPEAAAAAEAYVQALEDRDAEAMLAVVNVAVYEYVFSDTSWGADELAQSVADGNSELPEETAIEVGDDVSVQLIHTVSNTAYVAIVATRPNTEPTPVNGIMVLELSEFPERGWLVTRDYRHGL